MKKFGSYIELHTHTKESDGKYSCEELIEKAIKNQIGVLSITDHNHFMGMKAFYSLQEKYKDRIILIPGMEVSVNYVPFRGGVEELHLVVLCKDMDKLQFLTKRKIDHRARFEAQREALRAASVEIPDYDTFLKRYPDTNHVGRKLIGEYMYETGMTSYPDEGFDKYFGRWGERLAYIDTAKYRSLYKSMEETIREIREAAGDSLIAIILAHPLYYHFDEAELNRMMQIFADAAGPYAAMEVYYRRYIRQQEKAVTEMLLERANHYGFLISCASDFHGQSEEDGLDNEFPMEYWLKIVENAEKIHNQG